ncbi:pro-sigmaK processing inhibitor BofA family protein [Ectobacillus ponti]|uniref:Pro-sigmaK processing inhibitor BofA family protein n=1 Tax=Ectobacillus ponti TaxID=2961894 RepID=A0AA42BRF9_9BACI|nr:pro-sigmaK processing inhibitor BofA family protein [Ectobacillus ponti]MCP8971350.1 pro-sigmaK processing inhibitor BofA family protein [Ectobacillus ponti]
MDHLLIIGGIAGGIILLLLIGGPFKPFRAAGKTLMKIVVGALGLFLLNTVGAQWNFHIPINVITASICGLLGLPGFGALAVIQLYILPH